MYKQVSAGKKKKKEKILFNEQKHTSHKQASQFANKFQQVKKKRKKSLSTNKNPPHTNKLTNQTNGQTNDETYNKHAWIK